MGIADTFLTTAGFLVQAAAGAPAAEGMIAPQFLHHALAATGLLVVALGALLLLWIQVGGSTPVRHHET